ncbi:DNA-processing protein DprA [Candidatus Pacearchaeota archaeon]|nr:DNA-processing protein DprA [Candidatus Pacearchaeota archaeon]
MKWIAISGSWRKTNEQVEADVRKVVREIITSGKGIVSGGALGVDYIATDEALTLNPSATQIRIYLPTTLQIYSAHYRKRAKEGVITSTQAELLISQLERLVRINKDAIIENRDNELVNQETYYKRNMRVIESSDELVAFHINGSEGTLDAINKAKQKGIPVKKLEYTIK